jgi:hypothetical protein
MENEKLLIMKVWVGVWLMIIDDDDWLIVDWLIASSHFDTGTRTGSQLLFYVADFDFDILSWHNTRDMSPFFCWGLLWFIWKGGTCHEWSELHLSWEARYGKYGTVVPVLKPGWYIPGSRLNLWEQWLWFFTCSNTYCRKLRLYCMSTRVKYCFTIWASTCIQAGTHNYFHKLIILEWTQ